MKNIKLVALALTGGVLSLTPGCLTTETETVKEPALAESAKPEVATTTPDIEVIEQEDTTGRVSAAREAAEKLISDAKKEAAQIRQAADKVMAVKTYEAEKKAEEILASIQKQAKTKKAELIKSYLKEQQTVAQKKAAEIIDAAKKKAAKIVAEADKYAKTAGSKAKKEYDKIAAQMIKNAKKSVADITAKGGIDAEKIRKEAKKLFVEAKAYTGKQKKKAEEYLAKKLKEADAEVAKITEKMKKNQDKDAKPALADNMLSTIMKGMKDDDYASFTKNFTQDLKTNFTEKKFKALNAQLKGKIGEYKKRMYMGSLQKGPLRVYLWKAEFTNAKNNDLVIRLTLGELDKKDQVFAFDISNL